MSRGLKFRIKEVEELYFLCSENKDVDQLRGGHEANLRLRLAYMHIAGFLMRLNYR